MRRRSVAGVVLSAAVVELFVVLPKQIGAVVAAIRGAHDGVHVMSAGDLVVEHHAGMMVEFDEDHRAVHPVVERRLIVEAAVPREPCFVEVRDDLLASSPRRARRLASRRRCPSARAARAVARRSCRCRSTPCRARRGCRGTRRPAFGRRTGSAGSARSRRDAATGG